MASKRIFIAQPVSGPPSVDVNVTPMIDIVLVLLIIFMTVSPLRDAAIRTTAADQAEGPGSDVVLIEVDAAGALRLGGEAIAEAEQVGAVRAALSRQRTAAVMVSPAAATPYPQVIRALDVAKRAGAETLGFPAE